MASDIISLGVELDPRRLSAGVRESQRQLRALDAQTRRNGTAFQQLSKETGRSVPELRRMAAESIRAERNFARMQRETGLTASQLTHLRTQATSTTTRLSGLAGQLGILAGPLGFVGVGVAAVRAIRSLAAFETRMAEISTIASGGREQVAFLRKEILELSKVMPKTADDLGAGAYQILSAGFTDAADASDILKASTTAAVAGLTSVERAVDAVTTILNAYQKPATEAARVSDILFETVKLGKLKFEDIATNIGEAATAAALMGISVEELTAGMATMTIHGINAAESVTALNRLFLTLVDKQGDAAKKFEELGIDFSTAAVAQKGFAGIMADLNRLTAGQVDELAQLFPELRAAKGAFIIAGAGAETYKRILDGTIASTGSATKAAAMMNETLESQAQIVKNQLNVELEKLGTLIIPVIKSVLQELTRQIGDASDKFSNFGDAIRRDIIEPWKAFNKEIYKRIEFRDLDTAKARLVELQTQMDALRATIEAGKIETPFSDRFTEDANAAREEYAELRGELERTTEEVHRLSRALDEYAAHPALMRGGQLVTPAGAVKVPSPEEMRREEKVAREQAQAAAIPPSITPPPIPSTKDFWNALAEFAKSIDEEIRTIIETNQSLSDISRELGAGALYVSPSAVERRFGKAIDRKGEYLPEIKAPVIPKPVTPPEVTEAPPGIVGVGGEDVRNFYDDMTDGFQDMSSVWRTGFSGMSMILSDFITGGIQGFEDLGDAILRMFQRLALEKAFETIGGYIGIKGFQAGGTVPGPVGAPQLAVVHGGEEVIPVHGRNRETVTVSQNINFNISALDAPSVQQLLTQQKGTITAVVAEAINDSDTIRRLITRR